MVVALAVALAWTAALSAAEGVYVELVPQSDDRGHFVAFPRESLIGAGVSGVVAAPGPVTRLTVNGRPARLLKPRSYSRPLGAPAGLSVARFVSPIARGSLAEAVVTVTYGGGSAQTLTFRRDTAATIARLRELVAAAPRDTEARCALGVALDTADRLAEAEAELRKAVAVDPAGVAAHFALAGVLLRQEKTEAALAEYQAVVGIDPASSSAHLMLGWVQHMTGKAKPALAEVRRAVALEPDSPTLLCFAALVVGTQQPDEGLALLRQAVALEPTWARPRALLAEMLLAQKQSLEEAAAQARKAVELEPQSVEGYCVLAAALQKQDKPAEAIAECRKALAIDPNSAPAHARLGHLLCCEEKRAEGIAECRKAIETEPDTALAQATLAAALYLEGDYLAAEQAQLAALKLGTSLKDEVADEIRSKAKGLKCWNMDPRLPMGLVLVPLVGLMLGGAIGAAHASIAASFTRSLAWRQLTRGALWMAVGSGVWLALQWGFLIHHIGPGSYDFCLLALWTAMVGVALGLVGVVASLAGRPSPFIGRGLGLSAVVCGRCRQPAGLWDLYAEHGEPVCSKCLPLAASMPPGPVR